MVAEEDWVGQIIKEANSIDEFNKMVFNKFCDAIASMAVERVMRKIREEEIYLSFIKQERL